MWAIGQRWIAVALVGSAGHEREHIVALATRIELLHLRLEHHMCRFDISREAAATSGH